MAPVFWNVLIVALSEIFANFNLRWFATSNAPSNLVQGLLGYGSVLYFLTRAFRTDNVLYVNALWDGMSAILQSIAAFVILGDRFKSGQEYVGILLIFAGVFILNMTKN
jgi:multidrug transporter EmrE-like cation transporter